SSFLRHSSLGIRHFYVRGRRWYFLRISAAASEVFPVPRMAFGLAGWPGFSTEGSSITVLRSGIASLPSVLLEALAGAAPSSPPSSNSAILSEGGPPVGAAGAPILTSSSSSAVPTGFAAPAGVLAGAAAIF